MHNTQDRQKVLALRDAILSGSESRLKEQRDAGKLTARERVEKLADAGSFTEMFALMSQSGEGAGVITGCATIQERPVYIFAQDFTVRGGAMGAMQAAKITRLTETALKTGTPVIALLDSAGVRIDEGAEGMSAFSDIAKAMARLSGVCPMIAIVLGPCIGGAALMARMADVTIITEKIGTLMVYGPQVLAAMNGVDVNPAELGGAETAAKQGLCDLIAKDEDEAFALAQKVLDLLPSNNLEDSEIVDTDDMDRLLTEGTESDPDALLKELADQGSLLELNGKHGICVRTALARLGGHSVAILLAKDQLCPGGMEKAARFVRFADSFNLPIITLMDVSGIKLKSADQQGRVMTAAAQMLSAYADATAPKLPVVYGDAIGQAYGAMGGKGVADVTYAWPGAVISAMTPEAAVAVLYGDEVKADKELSVEEARAKYAAQYIEECASAIKAAEKGMLDDIIEPAKTRAALISAVEMLLSKRESNPPKKHGNMPL